MLNNARPGAAERLVRDLFATAGVHVNGSAPTDIRVKDPRFYARFLSQSTLGFGESYMDGWWESDQLDTTVEMLIRADLRKQVKGDLRLALLTVKALVMNMQSVARADEVAKAHYDLGNDLYKAMLDKRMVYTCAYWKDAKTLDEAQEAKLDLVCRKLGLEKGMKLLDLGCGWGGLASWAAEKYGCEVTAISISKEQIALAKEMWKGLPIDFILGDYRDAKGQFDRVVSVGMLEHIGFKNHRTFMKVVERTLKKDGVALLHTIGNNLSALHADPFVHKWVFPNAMSPSLAQLAKAMEGILVVEDLHNIGEHYAPTLVAWWQNFDASWPRLKGARYDDRFYRMWKYYLLGAAGLSRSRDGQLYQIVVTRTGRKQPECRAS